MLAWANGRKMTLIAIDDRSNDRKTRIVLSADRDDEWCGTLIVPSKTTWPIAEAEAQEFRTRTFEEALGEVSKEPGKLEIDVSGLWEGPVKFLMELFLKKAESVIASKESKATLTKENAVEWGYIEEKSK